MDKTILFSGIAGSFLIHKKYIIPMNNITITNKQKPWIGIAGDENRITPDSDLPWLWPFLFRAEVVGESDEIRFGSMDGRIVVSMVGSIEGSIVGSKVGSSDGDVVGGADGFFVGFNVGDNVGGLFSSFIVGFHVVGFEVGSNVGSNDGFSVGMYVGISVGISVGI